MLRKTRATVAEIWAYRAYLKYETLGKLSLRHKGTMLGYLWWVLDPLLFMGIYYLVFGIILRRGTSSYVLFLFSALLPWRWFQTSISEGACSIRSSGRLIKQVYFPKLLTPLSAVLTNTINFTFGLPVLGVFMVIFHADVGWNLAWFPVIVLVQLTFTAGVAFLLADLVVSYRDMENFLTYILQMWFYLSPVFYPARIVPARIRPIFLLNPFVSIMESYRDVVMHNRTPHVLRLSAVMVVSLLMIWLGSWLVLRHQGDYAKVL